MDEEELIKQKMKETKKQINSGNIGYVYGIIVSIIQALSSFIISKNTQWFAITLISYMVVSAYMIIFFQTILPIHNDNMRYKMAITHIYTSPIIIALVCFYRQMGFWSIIIGLIYFILIGICSNDITSDKTEKEFEQLDNLAQKAVSMECKKMKIFASILAIIGGSLASVYSISFVTMSNDSIIYSILSMVFIIAIWDFITYITLKIISKRKEKILNVTFNLKIGEMTKRYEYDKLYNTHMLYNRSIWNYKFVSIFITIIGASILIKFNFSYVSLITMIYLIVNTAMTLDKGHIHITPPEKTASIYNATGSKTGEIKYR